MFYKGEIVKIKPEWVEPHENKETKYIILDYVQGWKEDLFWVDITPLESEMVLPSVNRIDSKMVQPAIKGKHLFAFQIFYQVGKENRNKIVIGLNQDDALKRARIKNPIRVEFYFGKQIPW